MGLSTSLLINCPPDAFQHIASYLDSTDQNSLATTNKDAYQKIVDQRMRIAKNLYEDLYKDFTGEKPGFARWSQQDFVLEKLQIEQALFQSLTKSQELFTQIIQNLENSTEPDNKRAKEFLRFLPRSLKKEKTTALKHIKNAVYAELCKSLLLSQQLYTSHLLSCHIPQKKHLNPVLIDQMKQLIKQNRIKSAFQIATSFQNQTVRKEAYKHLLNFSLYQSPLDRNALIEDLKKHERKQANASADIIKQCDGFQKFPERKKRKAEEQLTPHS